MTEGKRFNEGKPMLSLNPPEAAVASAEVWQAGIVKYGTFNWRQGGPQLSFMQISASLLRHLYRFLAGEDFDQESGFPHTSHILCNAQMLATFFSEKDMSHVVDDRYRRVETTD